MPTAHLTQDYITYFQAYWYSVTTGSVGEGRGTLGHLVHPRSLVHPRLAFNFVRCAVAFEPTHVSRLNSPSVAALLHPTTSAHAPHTSLAHDDADRDTLTSCTEWLQRRQRLKDSTSSLFILQDNSQPPFPTQSQQGSPHMCATFRRCDFALSRRTIQRQPTLPHYTHDPRRRDCCL